MSDEDPSRKHKPHSHWYTKRKVGVTNVVVTYSVPPSVICLFFTELYFARRSSVIAKSHPFPVLAKGSELLVSGRRFLFLEKIPGYYFVSSPFMLRMNMHLPEVKLSSCNMKLEV